MQPMTGKRVLVLRPVVPDTQQVSNLESDHNFQKCQQIHIGVQKLSAHGGLFWNHRCGKYSEPVRRIGTHGRVCMVDRPPGEA